MSLQYIAVITMLSHSIHITLFVYFLFLLIIYYLLKTFREDGYLILNLVYGVMTQTRYPLKTMMSCK